MRFSRTIMIAATAVTLVAAPAAIASAASASTNADQGSITRLSAAGPWGPKYSTGKKSVARGTLFSSDVDKAHIPTVSTVRVKGTITDRTTGSGCGWAVFRITYRKSDGSLPFKHRFYLDCSKGSPRPFTFTDRHVALVELKVCSEPRASEPTLVCLYANSWKVLHSNL